MGKNGEKMKERGPKLTNKTYVFIGHVTCDFDFFFLFYFLFFPFLILLK